MKYFVRVGAQEVVVEVDGDQVRVDDRVVTARLATTADSPVIRLEIEGERHELADREQNVIARLRELPGQRWGFGPAQPWSATVVTSLFLHGDWMHLLGNLVFLWITAPFLEERVPTMRWFARLME